MKKYLITLLISFSTIFITLPAQASDANGGGDNLPPCPDTASVQTIQDGCQLHGSKKVLESSAVSYLSSALHVLEGLLADSEYRLNLSQETVNQQNATIAEMKYQLYEKSERIKELKYVISMKNKKIHRLERQLAQR